MLSMTVFVSGCIEIQAILSGIADTRDGGTSPSDGGGMTPGDGTDDSGSADVLPEVTLTVSNSNPSINEEVSLICRSDDPAQAVSSFAFLPVIDLISINSFQGTAIFIPSAGDAGTEFNFTCTGTNEGGHHHGPP